MKVSEVMTSSVVCVGATEMVALVRQVMRSKGIRHMPVVDAGMLIGILSDKDIPDFVKPQLIVADIMTVNPICVQESDSLEQARSLIRRHRIGSLPVLAGRRLVGIVTLADLF